MASGGAPDMSGGSLVVGGSNASTQSLGGALHLTAAQFSQLSLIVEKATVNPSSYQHYAGLKLLSKPNPYVEIVVDGKPNTRKTEFCRGTYQPRWSGEPFVMPVTPYSKMLFRLFDHSSFKRDALVAEANLELYPILLQNNGKCQMLQVSVELFLSNSSSKSSGNTSSSSHGGSRNLTSQGNSSSSNSNLNNMSSDRIGTSMAANSKVGELNVILDGLNVNMSQFPIASPTPAVYNASSISQNGHPQSFQTSPSISSRSNTNDNSVVADEGQARVSTSNNAVQDQNGAVANISTTSSVGNSNANKHNGGRGKRNSDSSQPTNGDHAGTTGRLPPLNAPSASDRKSGNHFKLKVGSLITKIDGIMIQ